MVPSKNVENLKLMKWFLRYAKGEKKKVSHENSLKTETHSATQ